MWVVHSHREVSWLHSVAYAVAGGIFGAILFVVLLIVAYIALSRALSTLTKQRCIQNTRTQSYLAIPLYKDTFVDSPAHSVTHSLSQDSLLSNGSASSDHGSDEQTCTSTQGKVQERLAVLHTELSM